MSDTPNTPKNRFGLKAALCLGVGLGALGVAAPAWSQDADEAATAEAEPRRLNQVVVSATRREGTTVQDVPIAVTALDAALLEEAGVDRINDLEQIAPTIQVTQGQSSATGTSISIRGLGTGGDNPGFEPAVGVFIDGVYRTKTGIALGDLPELASVEVLRGPQGTLFGRNTSSGALSIKTAGPEEEGRREFTIGIGEFDSVSGQFMATGAVSETLSARVDLKYRERGGYIEDVNSDREFNDIHRYLLRGQLRWEEGDANLRLIADYAETKENCCSAVNLVAGNPANPTTPGGIGLAVNTVAGIRSLLSGSPVVGIAQPGNPEAYQTAASPNRALSEEVDDWGVSAEYNNRFDIGRFTSITAYRDWKVVRDQDIDFSGIDRASRTGYTVEDTMFTQEFRLQGESGNIDWLVGAFYLNEELYLKDTIQFGIDGDLYFDAVTAGATRNAIVPNGLQLSGSLPGVQSLFVSVPNVGPVVRFGLNANPVLSFQASQAFQPFFIPRNVAGSGQDADEYKSTVNALALFTHNEIAFGDRTTLTVGVRYNFEEKELDYDLNSNVPTCAFFFTPAGQAVLTQLNAIGAGALGVLSCNPTVNSEFNGVDSDSREDSEFTGTLSLRHELTDDIMIYGGYSRGFKSGGWNFDRGSFDSVLFGGNGAQPSDLAFDAEIVDAFELGWKMSLLDGMATFNGAIYYQDIDGYQFNTFVGTSFVTYNTAAESQGVELEVGLTPVEGLVLQGGFAYTDITYGENPPQFPFPLAGEQVANVPEYVVTGSATYTFPLFGGLEGVAHANFRWQDGVETIIAAYDPGTGLGRGGPTFNDAFTTVNARLTIQAEDQRWALSVFGENLTEEYFNITTFPVPEQTGVYAGYPALPRFIGAEATFRF